MTKKSSAKIPRYRNPVEPGEFEIMVGNSSRDEDLQKVVLTVAK